MQFFQLSIHQLIQTSVTSPCEPSLGYMIAQPIPIPSHYKLFWFSKPSVSFAAFFTPMACPGFTDLHSCMSVGLLSHLLPSFRLSSLKMCICTCTVRSSEKLVCYGPSSSQNMVCPNIALYINTHVFLESESLLLGCLISPVFGFLVVVGSPDGLPQLLLEARSFFFSSSTLIYLQQTTKFIQYFVFEMGFLLCHSNWLCTSGLKQSSYLSLLSSYAPGCAQLYILYASVGFILSMTPRGRNYYSPNLPDERTAELHALSVPHGSKLSCFFVQRL